MEQRGKGPPWHREIEFCAPGTPRAHALPRLPRPQPSFSWESLNGDPGTWRYPFPTGEAALLSEWNERVEIHTLGEGFTWKTQDRERDVATAQRAWQKAVELLRDPSFDMVILDELNIVLRYDYLPLADVAAELTQKRPVLHVVVTGRNAKPALLEMADLVTEMRDIKHYWNKGVKARRGIEK